MENYDSILTWMLSRLPMYQKNGSQAYRPDLSRMRDFCGYLNHPQNQIKTIHVAGTNGKGSTAHLMASVMQQHRFQVGLYTSPHLKDFRERIKINGALIEKEFVVEFIQNHQSYIESNSLSFFEMTVGLAFSYFFKKKVDIAIVEVGMGGRLDGTNLIEPELCVITNIGLDHVQFLGDSLEAIAREKAGIIKSHTPVIIGLTQLETQAVFREKARQLDAEIIFADQVDVKEQSSDLKGNYQRRNIHTAVVGLSRLKGFKLQPEKLKEGLMNVVANTGLQGRWQVLNHLPMTVADVAHNREGLELTIDQIESHTYVKLHLVLGFVMDKAVDKILRLFPKSGRFYVCSPKIPRAMSILNIDKIARDLKLNYEIYASVDAAYSAAKNQAQADDFIYVGGVLLWWLRFSKILCIQ